MLNIIQDGTAAEKLARIFADSPLVPLLPPMDDSAWENVVKNPVAAPFVKTIADRATTELDEPMPVLTDELYEDFFKTGTRLRFELLYFERRRRVGRAAMAAITELDLNRREKFVRSLLVKLADILAEVSWTFPAHAHTVPSGKEPLCIDLFAAETANLCGELINVFGNTIPAAIQSQMKQRLRTQYFENFLNKPPHWTTITNNWNAVCHQGVMGAALAVCDDAALLGRLFQKTAEGLKHFLAGFARDGGSSEGPGYWAYGFGWFMELNRQLEARTRGQLSIVEGDDHIRAIAAFGPKMMLSNGFVVNFSDNSPRSAPGPAALQYLGDRFDDPFIAAYAHLGWQRLAKTGLPLDDQRGDFFKHTRVLLRCPKELGEPAKLPAVDLFLPDLCVAVLRFEDKAGRLWEFAGKGGHNDEHHNHNDVGSYLLNIDGHRLLTEIGQPEYTRAFFSGQRYENIAARSLGHPVPLINGQEQTPYKEFVTNVVKREFTAERATLSLDITPAYGPESACVRCVREFDLDKIAGRLRVSDTFELTRADALETALITETPVTLNDGVATISQDGVTLRITPEAGTTIREVQTHPYRTHVGKDAEIYRIVLTPTVIKTVVTIGCTVTLAKEE